MSDVSNPIGPMWNKDVTIQNLQSDKSQLLQVVGDLFLALKFYDGALRLNWAIDLNELETRANDTLTKHKDTLKHFGISE